MGEDCANFAHSSFAHRFDTPPLVRGGLLTVNARLIRNVMNKEDLIERIKTVIDMVQRSASMAPITPLYVSRMLNVPVEEVEEAMREINSL